MWSSSRRTISGNALGFALTGWWLFSCLSFEGYIMITLPAIIFEAYKNSDPIEGRGRDLPIAFFTEEKDAQALVQGEYGGGVKTHKVWASLADYRDQELAEVRKRAFAKLSPEERVALGLIKST
jgi:hypothetical protein